MEVGYAASFCFASNQVSQGYSPSNSLWNLACKASKIHNKRPISRSHSFLIINTQKRSPKSVVSSLPNDSKSLPRRERSSKYTDNAVVINPEDDGVASSEVDDRDVISMFRAGIETLQLKQGDQGNLLHMLKAVQLHILAREQWNASILKACQRNYFMSAVNLIHYLALKSLDKEKLQKELSSYGLLNIATISAHVLPSLSASIQMLEQLETKFSDIQKNVEEGVSSDTSLNNRIQSKFTVSQMAKKASDNNNRLFGKLQSKRTTHIMVTVGQEAAESDTLITDLVNAGTTIFRINCAHGNPSDWIEMIRKIKNNSLVLEKPVRILMDLAGPKLRTGKLKAGPPVMKISPKKNALGRTIYPARVWLTATGSGPRPAHVYPDAILQVDGQDFMSKLEIGSVVTFRDACGKRRTLKVTGKTFVFCGVGLMCECSKNAHVESGTKLNVKDKRYKSSFGIVVDVPPVEQFCRVKVGDLLTISKDGSNEDAKSVSSSPTTHRVTCSSGYLFDSVKPGEPIAFDDGKIWGVIKGTSSSEIVVAITHAGLKGTKLGSDKSINIPESNIRYEGLTSKDIMDLAFVAKNSDMVGFSFVRSVDDIVALRQELEKKNISYLPIILKIETRCGFEKLPFLLLEAMKSPNPVGVMIARGDLAVECGWEKLAEIQEEILSISRAAHVPVIWATQVLESLVKSGVPTRAEITDVAAGKRANCIMLNKGKFITEAVKTLDTILSTQ